MITRRNFNIATTMGLGLTALPALPKIGMTNDNKVATTYPIHFAKWMNWYFEFGGNDLAISFCTDDDRNLTYYGQVEDVIINDNKDEIFDKFTKFEGERYFTHQTDENNFDNLFYKYFTIGRDEIWIYLSSFDGRTATLITIDRN